MENYILFFLLIVIPAIVLILRAIYGNRGEAKNEITSGVGIQEIGDFILHTGVVDRINQQITENDRNSSIYNDIDFYLRYDTAKTSGKFKIISSSRNPIEFNAGDIVSIWTKNSKIYGIWNHSLNALGYYYSNWILCRYGSNNKTLAYKSEILPLIIAIFISLVCYWCGINKLLLTAVVASYIAWRIFMLKKYDKDRAILSKIMQMVFNIQKEIE